MNVGVALYCSLLLAGISSMMAIAQQIIIDPPNDDVPESVAEIPAQDEASPAIEAPPLNETLPVIEVTPVNETSPVIEAPPVDTNPPANEIPPVATVKPSVSPPFATATPTPYWEHPSFEGPQSTNEDGEACRLSLINEWLNGYSDDEFNSEDILSSPDGGYLDVTTLKTIQLTTLYQNIVEDCSFFLNEYNAAAGHTCNRQEWHRNDRFSNFWNIGPINMDGGWLLAADLFLTNNFQDSEPLIPCSDSCYVRYPQGRVERDCQRYGSDLREGYFDITKLTSVSYEDAFVGETDLKRSQQFLCDLGWLNADRAYQNLRMCASESKVARTMAFERDNSRGNGVSERTRTASLVANAYASQRQKQAQCAESAIDFVCPDLGSGDSYIYLDDDYGWDDNIYATDSAPSVSVKGIVSTAMFAFAFQMLNGW